MSRASTPTLLSLDRYSKVLGIVPGHFNQGVSAIVFPLTNRCSDVWFQASWQGMDSVSREELAQEIAIAEEDIANLLGWWPAPVWIEQEVAMYPRHHRPDVIQYGGRNVRGLFKSVKAGYGKVIVPGQRAVTLIESPSTGAATLVFSDEDGDGFSETVTVTATTTLTDACELKVYFYNENGEREWEIRPARSKSISAGTFTATYWAWQFIDPDHWEEIPTPDFSAIDLDTAVYVSQVDVYREFTDVSAVSAALYWETEPVGGCDICNDAGCASCTLTEQEGCIHIRDAERGIVVPSAATYTDGAWSSDTWTVCRDPDQVKIYYYSGLLSQRNLQGKDCDPLSNFWAQTIAMVATARLERPFCNCGNSTALAERWRKDLALAGEGSFNVPFEMLDNPLGTRFGEIRAWQRISKLAPDRLQGATAV